MNTTIEKTKIKRSLKIMTIIGVFSLLPWLMLLILASFSYDAPDEAVIYNNGLVIGYTIIATRDAFALFVRTYPLLMVSSVIVSWIFYFKQKYIWARRTSFLVLLPFGFLALFLSVISLAKVL